MTKVRSKARTKTRSSPAAKRDGGPAWRKKLAAVREELREVRATLQAIRNGEVDAIVMSGKAGHKVYSLTGAEGPYRVYIEHMQEGAVTVSADGLVLYCNQRFAEMLALPLEKVIGSHLPDNLAADDWKKIFGVVVGQEIVAKHEALLARPAGAPLPVHLTASKLPVGDETVICLVVTDLTGQKEKTELRLAKEVAEKANAEKDEFLAKLSHELRTPLTPTLFAVSKLEQDAELPGPVRQQLAMIRRNVELEARLIDDLLDLTRVAHGKLELHFASADFHAIVQQAIAICQLEIRDKHLKLGFSAGAKRPVVEGDAVRLLQAVWNLLQNAVKFTPDGGEITLRLGNKGAAIFVEVKDTGIGFAPEMAPALFGAFEQGGRQITHRFGGLGLGLAITRSIMEAHCGRVTARSEGLGQGAVFTLELPESRSAAAVAVPAVDVAATTESAKAPRQRRLLVVEDHADTRRALELLLRQANYSVKSAATAQEAITLAAEHPFDLVVSDLGLPDQSGLEMMAHLRDRFALKGIALSGYGMDGDVARSHEAGFSHHLTKPIIAGQLTRLLAELI